MFHSQPMHKGLKKSEMFACEQEVAHHLNLIVSSLEILSYLKSNYRLQLSPNKLLYHQREHTSLKNRVYFVMIFFSMTK